MQTGRSNGIVTKWQGSVMDILSFCGGLVGTPCLHIGRRLFGGRFDIIDKGGFTHQSGFLSVLLPSQRSCIFSAPVPGQIFPVS